MSRFTAETNQPGRQKRQRDREKERKRTGTEANYAARARAHMRPPRPPNGQFVFADCLYLGTLSRPEIAVSSFHLGREGIIRPGDEEEKWSKERERERGTRQDRSNKRRPSRPSVESRTLVRASAKRFTVNSDRDYGVGGFTAVHGSYAKHRRETLRNPRSAKAREFETRSG